MELIIWNITPVVRVAALTWAGGLAYGLAVTGAVLDISEFIQFRDHDKSGSILQLIKGKSRHHQKLLKYFNGTTTSVSKLLLWAGAFPIIFALYSKHLLAVVLSLFIL